MACAWSSPNPSHRSGSTRNGTPADSATPGAHPLIDKSRGPAEVVFLAPRAPRSDGRPGGSRCGRTGGARSGRRLSASWRQFRTHQDDFMRTTLTIEPDVEQLLQQEMRCTDRSMKAVVNDALRRGLSARSKPPKLPRFKFQGRAPRLRLQDGCRRRSAQSTRGRIRGGGILPKARTVIIPDVDLLVYACDAAAAHPAS